MPNKLWFGEVTGPHPPARPGSSSDDVVMLCDFQRCRINGHYRDAQKRLLCGDSFVLHILSSS